MGVRCVHQVKICPFSSQHVLAFFLSCHPIPMIAEVPCSQVVTLAKKAASDAAGSSSVAASCPVLMGLKRLSPKDAEEKLHPILTQHGLSLAVPISYVSEGLLDGFPRLKPLDFINHMAASGHINKLLGGKQVYSSGPLLQDFWDRYQVEHPDFSLFLEDDVDLSVCIPIFAHADGGRGYKKSEFMVFNWSSAIGSGTGKTNAKDNFAARELRRKRRAMNAQVNLLGHTFGTHFMWGAAPAMWHKDDSNFQEMMTVFGKDLKECFDVGVTCQGRNLRLVCIGLKADLKLQARAGRFTRWYSTSRKSPYDPNKPNQTPGHCCWLCPAGSVQFPYEEVHTEAPAWFQAMGAYAAVPPWRDGEINGLLLHSFGYVSQPAKFYLPDLFHIYLAGFGQDHAASCLVYMLGPVFTGSSVDDRLGSLNHAWVYWKKMKKVTTHTYTWTRNMLAFASTKVYPTGTWSKASDTAKIMEFILYMLELFSDKLDQDKILHYIQVAGRAMGECMRGLYKSDLWVESGIKWQSCFLFMMCTLRFILYITWKPPKLHQLDVVTPLHPSQVISEEKGLARRIVASGLLFLKAYAKLASLTYEKGLRLFVYKPKIHYFHHLMLQMRSTLNSGGMPLNPLAYSCSAAEDFIGRASLLSRRTAAATTEKRVLQRYLAGAADVWARQQ